MNEELKAKRKLYDKANALYQGSWQRDAKLRHEVETLGRHILMHMRDGHGYERAAEQYREFYAELRKFEEETADRLRTRDALHRDLVALEAA